MKIYWKHLIWNYTIRLWCLWKYRNSEWKEWHCGKLIVTGKRMKKVEENIQAIMKEGG